MASADPHALLSVEQMYAADKAAMDTGISGLTLMENAGRAIAEAVADRFAKAQVLILCGPGNNGGDGYVVARYLDSWGWPVRLATLGAVDELSGDAAAMAGRWGGEVEKIDTLGEDGLAGVGLVVDALFGAGLSRGLQGSAAAIMAAIARVGIPIVAADVPSGISGETGIDLGGACAAALTVTFFRLKTGHMLMPGREFCGDRLVADIGIPESVLATVGVSARRNHPDLWRSALRRPAPGDHKYNRGHAVVAGGPEMLGAARLATRAAQRAGTDMVTVASPLQQAPLYRLALESALVPAVKDTKAFADLLAERKVDAGLIGPGLGLHSPGALERVLVLLRADLPSVLDADALTLFQESPQLMFETASAPVVITPHEGEFARIFPDLAAATSSLGKIERARQAASRSNFIVVLKGADTVIAAPDGNVVVNDNAPAFLATAGSGDVMAGLCVGFLAQGMDAFSAACAAVWIHGATADRIGLGLIAEDMPDEIPATMKTIYDIEDESP